MSLIKNLFAKKSNSIINIYCTAGYPHINSTLEVMKALQKNGADIIELGMPYSDPLADGPAIQHSNSIALQNGMTIETLFEQLRNFRNTQNAEDAIRIPVILMGYMNPVLQYGFEKFCKKAAELPVDGLILPDLPEYEYQSMYGNIIKQYGLDFIFLITPETSEERIRRLDALSTGFLYAVSSSSITGSDKDFAAVESYLQRLQNMNLRNPALVGFGIKDKVTFQSACKYANGAIIGTAYIKAMEHSADIEADTKRFLEGVLS